MLRRLARLGTANETAWAFPLGSRNWIAISEASPSAESANFCAATTTSLHPNETDDRQSDRNAHCPADQIVRHMLAHQYRRKHRRNDRGDYDERQVAGSGVLHVQPFMSNLWIAEVAASHRGSPSTRCCVFGNERPTRRLRHSHWDREIGTGRASRYPVALAKMRSNQDRPG